MADQNSLEPCPEKPWQIAKKWQKQNFYRGSQYPPFSIEPLPYERQRLAGSGMTDEDRALRRQWIKDQELHHEPRFVKELKPRNFFRRLYMNPTDAFFNYFIPLIGKTPAAMLRIVIPRALLGLSGLYVFYYNIKYLSNDWTRAGGLNVFESKPMILTSTVHLPEKKHDDYYDRGFKARTALLYKEKDSEI
ncbi:uncharacterized protein LOC112573204 [Pomacea canaliculata]|uniref:uncharacterized protein LOC112573204 n=1 Tax=Pomacea canaliculata TaxID=400727 RepID=UPI000D7292E4|nr:uncharacterized protein LOC112573204 [Pomacea canaliculata]